MPNIFDNIVDKAKDLGSKGLEAAKDLGEKGIEAAKDLGEISKLKVQISQSEDTIKKVLTETVEDIFEKHPDFLKENYAEAFQKVTEAKETIAKLKEQIEKVKED